jgi:Lrp/AsnC family leucine-responsive transcriptional regulator
MERGINDVDRRILYLLTQNPDLSQTELSEHLKISQPAVSARMNKLKERGILTHFVGTEVRKAQLFLAKIDIVTSDAEHVLGFFDKCPLYLNSFLTSGRYNLTALLIGENIRSIMSCVDSHLRKQPFVKDMEFNVIVTPVRDFTVTIKPILDKKENTPCETNCSKCILYHNDRCLGCPASTHYKGTLL